MINKKENTVAISQDELDLVLKGMSVKPAKKEVSKETQEKIDLLKLKTKSVEKKLSKQNSSQPKTKKTKTEKLSVYYNSKLYGTAQIVIKNGKQRIELLSIKEQK